MGGVRIGFNNGEGTLDKSCIRSVLEIDGKIIVSKRLDIGRGSRICVGCQGNLKVEKMVNTSRLHLVCQEEMNIGDNVLVAWDTTIMDSDMHSIIDVRSNKCIPQSKRVTIEDDVWIGTRSIILKGTHISKGSIIGAGSVVSGKYNENYSIIAGNPAKVIKMGFTRFN